MPLRRCSIKLIVSASMVLAATAQAHDFGRPADAAEIKLWDIAVRPDGRGLPEGSGTVAHGKEVYQTWCQGCHGADGQGGIRDRLVGGQGTLTSDKPVKTVGSYWPYATTLFDYIRRAMPYPLPGSLSADDTYAVAAYILNLNGIVPEQAVLDKTSLPQIHMPNRAGFVPDAVFKLYNETMLPVANCAMPGQQARKESGKAPLHGAAAR